MAIPVSASCDKTFLALWLRGWGRTDDLTAALLRYGYFLKDVATNEPVRLRWHAWKEVG